MSLRNKEAIVRLAAAFITTEETPTDPPSPTDPPTDPPADPPVDPPVDDLSTLFTSEDIAARKEQLAAAKAEEERRAGLTDAERAAEDAAKAEEAAKNQVPEQYEFTAPEGMELDQEMLGEFEALAKDAKLPQAQAQELVNLGAKLVQKVQTQMQDAWDQKREGWLIQAQTDKEIGEDVKKGKDSITARAFATIATPEMKELMEELGIGDHPEVLRMFYRLAPLMQEDTFESGSSSTTKAAASVMYPSMEK